MPTVSRIPLAALQPDYGIAGEAYITACEALAVALSRNGVAVITLPSSKGQAVGHGLQTLLANRTQALPGCLLRAWQAGEPAENAAIEQVGAEVAERRVLAAPAASFLVEFVFPAALLRISDHAV